MPRKDLKKTNEYDMSIKNIFYKLDEIIKNYCNKKVVPKKLG